jgi:hypothetical protein
MPRRGFSQRSVRLRVPLERAVIQRRQRQVKVPAFDGIFVDGWWSLQVNGGHHESHSEK